MKHAKILAAAVVCAVAMAGCGVSASQRQAGPAADSDTAYPETSFKGEVAEDGRYRITGGVWAGDDVYVPESVDGVEVGHVGDGAFADCPAEYIELPDTVTDIGASAFQGCGASVIWLGSKLAGIGELAFDRCESLTWLSIPDSVPAIEGVILRGCPALEEVRVPKGTGIQGAFMEGCPNAVIVAEEGSPAWKWAEAAGIALRVAERALEKDDALALAEKLIGVGIGEILKDAAKAESAQMADVASMDDGELAAIGMSLSATADAGGADAQTGDAQEAGADDVALDGGGVEAYGVMVGDAFHFFAAVPEGALDEVRGALAPKLAKDGAAGRSGSWIADEFSASAADHYAIRKGVDAYLIKDQWTGGASLYLFADEVEVGE